jgi:hypothetical protein
MPCILDPTIHTAVERDGLPRLASYDDGSQHVLYLEDGLVRSKPLAEWGDAPKEPTQAESDAAIQARDAAETTQRQLRRQVRQRARDLKGKKPAEWNANDVKALLALLLLERGYLDGESLRDVGEER